MIMILMIYSQFSRINLKNSMKRKSINKTEKEILGLGLKLFSTILVQQIFNDKKINNSNESNSRKLNSNNAKDPALCLHQYKQSEKNALTAPVGVSRK